MMDMPVVDIAVIAFVVGVGLLMFVVLSLGATALVMRRKSPLAAGPQGPSANTSRQPREWSWLKDITVKKVSIGLSAVAIIAIAVVWYISDKPLVTFTAGTDTDPGWEQGLGTWLLEHAWLVVLFVGVIYLFASPTVRYSLGWPVTAVICVTFLALFLHAAGVKTFIWRAQHGDTSEEFIDLREFIPEVGLSEFLMGLAGGKEKEDNSQREAAPRGPAPAPNTPWPSRGGTVAVSDTVVAKIPFRVSPPDCLVFTAYDPAVHGDLSPAEVVALDNRLLEWDPDGSNMLVWAERPGDSVIVYYNGYVPKGATWRKYTC